MTITAIKLPWISPTPDVVDTFERFLDAMCGIAAWAPTIIDDKGEGSPRNARWLRALLSDPLRRHIAEEDNVLLL